MDRIASIKCYILIGMILTAVMIILWRMAKWRKRSIFWLNCILGAIVFTCLLLYSSSYVYNQAGIRFDDTEWIDGAYKDQVYYTESGQIFYIQNDMLIPVNGAGESYSLDCSYLNNKGYLIFDTDRSFTQLDISNEYILMAYGDSAGIYLSEEYGHVYELRSCAWNVWGNLITPEGRGIKIGNLYLVPFSLSEEYRDLKNQILSWIGCCSMFALVFLSAFKIIYLLIKERKDSRKDYDACMSLVLSMAAFLNMIGMTGIFNSFMIFCTGTFISSVVTWYIMIFVQGRIQMEYFMEEEIKEVYPGGVTLRDMKEYAVLSEVSLWRKRYIKLISIYSIWWLVLCVLYSI